jgi:hypothetical protein
MVKTDDGKPVCPGRPFDLELYFVMYPDLSGGQPQISVEILRDGQTVGRSQVALSDSIRDTSRDDQGGGAGAGAKNGEQKGEFPHIAAIRNVTFGAANTKRG